MFSLLPLIGAAVGAAAGAFATHAAGERDRQAARYHRQIANDLSGKYSKLEEKYHEYSDKSKQQINELTRQNALNEAEKDFLRLAIRLQQSLYTLMWDIDESPTRQSLIKFEQAVLATNTVLFELNEEFIQVPDKYFSRNLKRASGFFLKFSGEAITGNIYPIKQCPKCGQRNRINPYDLKLHPICGKCRSILKTEETEADGVVEADMEDRSSDIKSSSNVCEQFTTYKDYLEWFRYTNPTMKPFSKNAFYKSLRYQSEL